MQDLGQICRFLWANLWTYGQNRGQDFKRYRPISVLGLHLTMRKFQVRARKLLSMSVVVCLSAALNFTVSMDANAATKMVSITWSAKPLVITFEPSAKFVPGKKPNANLLKSEAKSWCIANYGFVGLLVVGASGKDMGYSGTKSKLVINLSKVISAKWGLDEYGEDIFTLSASCYGSLASPITAKSNSYSFYLHTEFPCNYYKNTKYCIGGFYSPSYTPDELAKSQWVINVAFGDDWDRESTQNSELNVWDPVGSNS